MKEEMNSLEKNKTRTLDILPKGNKIVQNKWIYRVKEEYDERKRYKTRLVVNRFH